MITINYQIENAKHEETLLKRYSNRTPDIPNGFLRLILIKFPKPIKDNTTQVKTGVPCTMMTVVLGKLL